MGFIKNRVSVVTTVLNGEKFLSRILESVLEQSYRDLEMILVDGGSSDRTMAVAEGYREKFKENGMEYRIIAGHGNTAAGMNQGFPFVQGEFLIWPDADDALEKDSIKKRVEFLQTHLQYQCVRSLGYYVREGTEERVERDEPLGDLDNENLFFPLLFSETFLCCGCYMLRSERFFEIYPERKIPVSKVNIGQNLQMLLPFMYRYPCPTIREELYRVYKRSGSITRTPMTEEQKEEKIIDLGKLVDAVVKVCPIEDKEEIRRIEAWKAGTLYYFYLKHRKRYKAVISALRMYQYGGLTLWKLVGYEVDVFCGELKYHIWKLIRDFRRINEEQ